MKADKVVLFMKGDRDTPRCGFSQKIIGILEKEGYEYSTFDILSDESVRQSASLSLRPSPSPPALLSLLSFLPCTRRLTTTKQN